MSHYAKLSFTIITIIVLAIVIMGNTTVQSRYSVSYSDPAEPTRQLYEPLISGIQIYIDWPGDYDGVCTIGYAVKDQYGNIGVLTASHCVGDETFMYVYQPIPPSMGNGRFIGIPESVDLHTDSAFIPYDSSSPQVLYIFQLGDNLYEAIKAPIVAYYDWDTLQFLLNIGIYRINRTDRTFGTVIGVINNLYLVRRLLGRNYYYVISYAAVNGGGASGAPLYFYSDNGAGSNPEAILIGHHIMGNPSTYQCYGISVTGIIKYHHLTPVTGSTT